MRSPLPKAIPALARRGLLRQALVTNHERRVLRAPGGPVSVVAFASTGGRMLAGDAGGGLRVYSTNGRLERTFAVAGPVAAASFSPDGALVLGAAGREAVLWRAGTGERLQTLHLPGAVTSAVFSRDGRVVLTTTARGATVWRTDTGRPVAVLEKRAAVKGAFSPDGGLVATLDAKTTHDRPHVRIFDARTGRLLHVLAPTDRARGRRRFLRTPPSWRRQASRARTSGMPGAAGRSALASSTGPAWPPTRPSARTAICSPSRPKTAAFGSGIWRRVTVATSFRSHHFCPRGRVEPGWGASWRMPAWTGPCMCCRRTSPSEAAWWAISSATVPLCGQLPGGRTDARCSAAAQTARRDCGTPSSIKNCAPSEATAAPRWSVVRRRRAPHRVGRKRGRHRPDLECSRPAPSARPLAPARGRRRRVQPGRPPGRDCELGRHRRNLELDDRRPAPNAARGRPGVRRKVQLRWGDRRDWGRRRWHPSLESQ